MYTYFYNLCTNVHAIQGPRKVMVEDYLVVIYQRKRRKEAQFMRLCMKGNNMSRLQDVKFVVTGNILLGNCLISQQFLGRRCSSGTSFLKMDY